MLVRCSNCGSVVRVDAQGGQCKECNQMVAAGPPAGSRGRITLTKAQLNLPEVEEFVEMLVKIASDGAIEYEELQTLTAWLNDHANSEVPAIRFLIDLMVRVCGDGRITDEEVFEIQLAIERVLPKEFRASITETRKAAHYSQPASGNQMDLIEKLSGSRPAGLSKRAASELIEQLFESPPASNRQLMFLRFWNRMDLANSSRREIAEWMDAFIQEDHARWLAWDLFKNESGDDGSQRDPSFVPIGASDEYLQRVNRQYH